MSETKWPATTTWLTADDICRHQFTDGHCHCLGGWVQEDFGVVPPLIGSDFLSAYGHSCEKFFVELRSRLAEAAARIGQRSSGNLFETNDNPRLSKSLLARVYNETCEFFGYTEFAPEKELRA